MELPRFGRDDAGVGPPSYLVVGVVAGLAAVGTGVGAGGGGGAT